LFCFHQKKSAADAYKIICENVIECIRIDLNDLKTIISISVTKNAPDFRCPAVVEDDELRKDRKKSWKIFRLIYIVSIYCNKKDCKKSIAKTFAST